ncbi:hypothetical protein WR25_05464 [Diploscapter pachys]|uniref:Uncharacterized protein n=1 Tax=Diploscapter pachys TaxID=2018661 RepID=A0A2A2KMM9_9BILA|nr:hypothetical protein WR25_05464 [Diploscapter pachys]
MATIIHWEDLGDPAWLRRVDSVPEEVLALESGRLRVQDLVLGLDMDQDMEADLVSENRDPTLEAGQVLEVVRDDLGIHMGAALEDMEDGEEDTIHGIAIISGGALGATDIDAEFI